MENEIAKQLHHVVSLLSRESDQMLQEQLGIGLSQYKILITLQKYPEVQQKVVAKELGQTEASISRQIKLLQQRGMVMSLKNPNNQREHLAGLTMKGARIITAAEKVLASYHQTFFTCLSEKQQQKLSALLSHI
jgi:DNA-binding MarR family transcriptional regulator